MTWRDLMASRFFFAEVYELVAEEHDAQEAVVQGTKAERERALFAAEGAARLGVQ